MKINVVLVLRSLGRHLRSALLALLVLAPSAIVSRPSDPKPVKPKTWDTAWALWQAATPLEAFAYEEGRFPPSDLRPFREVVHLIQPFAIEMLPTRDSWGHDFLYASCGSSYVLVAVGRTGVINMLPRGGPTANDACSLALVGGDSVPFSPYLWQGPEGLDITAGESGMPLFDLVLGAEPCPLKLSDAVSRLAAQ